MAAFQGTIAISDMPPHRGIIVNLCFFSVPEVDASPPYDGDPPAEKATDCQEVLHDVHPDEERSEAGRECSFSLQRDEGYYFIQIRVILFRQNEGRLLAQAEQFFFRRRPLVVSAAYSPAVTFPIRWPDTDLGELHHYGTIAPRKTRPWWRFWTSSS